MCSCVGHYNHDSHMDYLSHPPFVSYFRSLIFWPELHLVYYEAAFIYFIRKYNSW